MNIVSLKALERDYVTVVF